MNDETVHLGAAKATFSVKSLMRFYLDTFTRKVHLLHPAAPNYSHSRGEA
jgi:hypothetical protein